MVDRTPSEQAVAAIAEHHRNIMERCPDCGQKYATLSTPAIKARPIDEYTEDMGPVLWWTFPITEAPYCGTPNDCGQTVEMRHYVMKEASPGNWVRDVKTVRSDVGGWPGYHTHFTPIEVPEAP